MTEQYLHTFICPCQVKAVSHDVSKLTLLMHTVESLVQNQALFLETQPYVSTSLLVLYILSAGISLLGIE